METRFILIDLYTKEIENKQFLVCVIYSKQAKAISKVYKSFNDSLYERLSDLLYEDISAYVVPKVKNNGTAGLDINL